MERLRIGFLEPAAVPCSRCAAGSRQWDRIAQKAYCPSCQERLVLGETEPLTERVERRRCVVCGRIGTVRFATYPIKAKRPVEMDICGEHLRSLLGRTLGAFAFHQLRRQLRNVRLQTEDIFLLHGAFYNGEGKALRPALP
jgi:hypothetical protein